MIRHIKQKVGAIILDVPRYLYHLYLSSKKLAWTQVRNRDEQLINEQNQHGVKCDWQWTSDLYLPRVFPSFGERLYRQAFNDFPIVLSEAPLENHEKQPHVSFIIGHRGIERAPLLLKTIESIAGQKGCEIECIVVEQDLVPRVQSSLPNWVRHLFTPMNEPAIPFSRSRAFNDGAAIATADCLIFHDNDLLIPARYALEAYNRFKQGFEFINLKRFIFYLSQAATSQMLSDAGGLTNLCLDSIMQNAEGGGSIAASKQAFFDIGQFDERFIGWGGEDNEFWERAETRKIWPFTKLPLIHMWHASQKEKLPHAELHQTNLYWTLHEQSPEERIRYLRSQSAPTKRQL